MFFYNSIYFKRSDTCVGYEYLYKTWNFSDLESKYIFKN